MRIRYAYKLEGEKKPTKFVVWNWVKQEEEVLAKYKSEGYTKCTFHDRVRTGFRMLEDGKLQETGLATPVVPKAKPAAKPEAPVAPTAPKAPAKKVNK